LEAITGVNAATLLKHYARATQVVKVMDVFGSALADAMESASRVENRVENALVTA
jgi:hypothetical protein